MSTFCNRGMDDQERGWSAKVSQAFPGIIAGGVLALTALVYEMRKEVTVAVTELRACLAAVQRVSDRVDKVEARQSQQEAGLTELRTIVNMTKGEP